MQTTQGFALKSSRHLNPPRLPADCRPDMRNDFNRLPSFAKAPGDFCIGAPLHQHGYHVSIRTVPLVLMILEEVLTDQAEGNFLCPSPRKRSIQPGIGGHVLVI